MIVIISNAIPPDHSGAGKRMYSFFQYLIRNNYEAKYITYTPSANENVVVIKKYKIDKYFWKIIPISAFISSLVQIALKILNGNFKSTDGIRTVWLVSTNPMAAAASVIFRLSGFRIITQNVLMHSDDPSRRPGGRLNITHKLRMLQYRNTHVVTSNSIGLYELSKPHHPNCIIIPNPVEIQVIKNTIKPGNKTDILFIGRISFRKGADIVIKVIDLIHQTEPELKFTFVGPYDDMDNELMKIYNSCKNINRSNVIFAGYQEDTVSWYRKADIFFLPSRREGFPTVFIEAMSYGIPVVAKKLDGITGYIFDNGYPAVVDSNDPVEYAEELMRLIHNNTYYTSVVEMLGNKVSRFDKNRIYNQYIKLIKNP
jgi:glycosyltransferase involved in cell wall biosynthesis